MDLQKKLEILSAAAKYDVSCSSSGSTRKNTKDGIGNSAVAGICHSWSNDGRCISLLKILLSNYCIYDCAYCVNRISNDIPRASFTPLEVSNLTLNFYKRNYIEGLFLSSSIIKNPNYTMELLYECVRLLRHEYKFNGYIHIKAIPGADLRLIELTGLLVDRMSVNIELPSSKSLNLLAPQKEKSAILKPMGFINNKILEKSDEKKIIKKDSHFVPGGQSTQLIVGASPENDLSILKLSEGLYKRYHLKRVYYSAYVPVSESPNLPALIKPPLLREHRLYQADWLLRFYGFNAQELLDDKNPNFDMYLDPKANWAINNMSIFPVDVNKADYELLLRVPGIGVRSARKITMARRVKSLSLDDLKKIGVVLKRAKYFITCSGKYLPGLEGDPAIIRAVLKDKKTVYEDKWEQLTIFSLLDNQKEKNITNLQQPAMNSYIKNITRYYNDKTDNENIFLQKDYVENKILNGTTNSNLQKKSSSIVTPYVTNTEDLPPFDSPVSLEDIKNMNTINSQYSIYSPSNNDDFMTMTGEI